jgi:hypothetical protein
MNIRHAIAAVALSTATLLSGASLAADFAEQLSEAKTASLNATSREIRDTVAIHLSVAQSLNEQGKQAGAQSYLDFARGKLGLNISAQAPAVNIGEIVGLRDEAR